MWTCVNELQAEKSASGGRTNLEMIVALNTVRTLKHIQLEKMEQICSNDYLPLGTTMSRYLGPVQAGSEPAELPTDLSRTQSMIQPPPPSVRQQLHHSNTVGGQPTEHGSRSNSRNTDQQSLNQAGLETNGLYEGPNVNAALEFGNPQNHQLFTHPLRSIAATPLTQCPTHLQSKISPSQRLANLLGNISIHVGRRQKTELATPIEEPSSSVDDEEARALLAFKRLQDPKFKDPSKALKRAFTSARAKHRTSDQRQWEYSKEELDNALHGVVNTSGHVGVVRSLLNMGADANSVRDVHRRSINILRDSNWTLRPVKYINVAAMNNQVEVVALLARRGASAENKSKALETAVQRDLATIFETLLRYANCYSSMVLAATMLMEKLSTLPLNLEILPCCRQSSSETSILEFWLRKSSLRCKFNCDSEGTTRSPRSSVQGQQDPK